jgi:hypothetical protein
MLAVSLVKDFSPQDAAHNRDGGIQNKIRVQATGNTDGG